MLEYVAMLFSNLREANKYLETLIPSPKRTPLDRRLEKTAHLLRLCGNPHEKLQLIHIGGTSGKGSVAYFLSRILTGQGYKVGLHVSPHLQIVTERAQINGQLMLKEKFSEYVERFKPLITQVEKDLKPLKINYFETLVAIALKYFADEKVDIAIIEVGIGGSFDATNVINPLISIITNVGLAHTGMLGKTIQKIAKDKAGIIKRDSLVITGAKQPSVQRIISEKAENCNSDVSFLDRDFSYKIKTANLTGSIFDFRWEDKIYRNLALSAPGLFQIENASTALAASCLLPQLGFKIDQKKIYKALEKVKIPGRFEVVQKRPLIILDAAHNMVKIKTFLSSLTYVLPNQKFIFVTTFVTLEGNKEVAEILKRIMACAKAFVVVEFSQAADTNRQLALSAGAVAALLKKLNFSGDIVIEKRPREALAKAKKLANKTDIIVITGSLYLVGEIRDLFFPIK